MIGPVIGGDATVITLDGVGAAAGRGGVGRSSCLLAAGADGGVTCLSGGREDPVVETVKVQKHLIGIKSYVHISRKIEWHAQRISAQIQGRFIQGPEKGFS